MMELRGAADAGATTGLVAAAKVVVNIIKGMLRESDARDILIDLGFGPKFVCQLTLRTLQLIGYARGFILMMGTGTYMVANLTGSTSIVNINRVNELFLCLKPMFEYIISGTLGTSWLRLGITFQFLQSLFCERRKHI